MISLKSLSGFWGPFLILQVCKEQAEINACKMEHLLSIETGEKLLGFMSFPLSDDPKVKASLNDY